MNRRNLLKRAGTAGIVGVTGCLRLESGGDTKTATSITSQAQRTTADAETTTEADTETTQETEDAIGARITAYSLDGTPEWTFENGHANSYLATAMDATETDVAISTRAYETDNRLPLLAVIDASTGTRRWERELEQSTGVYFDDGNLLAIGGDANIDTYDVNSGERLTRTATDKSIGGGETLVRNGTVYTAGWQVRVIDTETGSLRWERTDANEYYFIGVAGDTVATGTTAGYLQGLNATDGSKRWEHRVENSLRSSNTVVHDGVLWTVDSGGRVYATDIASGSMLYSGQPDETAYETIAVTDDLLVLGARSSVHGFTIARGGDQYSLTEDWAAFLTSARLLSHRDSIYAYDGSSLQQFGLGGTEQGQVNTRAVINRALFDTDRYYLATAPDQ